MASLPLNSSVSKEILFKSSSGETIKSDKPRLVLVQLAMITKINKRAETSFAISFVLDLQADKILIDLREKNFWRNIK